jgi:hypothetical protein
MIRRLDDSRFRTALLLLALTAGGVATLFVPPYQDIAFAPEEEAASAPATPGRASPDMTGIDVDLRHVS